MQRFLITRLLAGGLAVLGATFIVFVILRVLPGDIATFYLRGQSGDGAVRPEDVVRVKGLLGLDKPLHEQYLGWVWGLLRGDAGRSLWLGGPVMEEILHRLPISVQLAAMAAVFGLALGMPLGIISAMAQDSPLDYLSRLFSIAFLAIPNFWLGLLILLVTVNYFGWMPPIGYFSLVKDPMQNLMQLSIPAAVVGASLMATVARMTRSSMLEVLREDYIRTARAKGLAGQKVILRHALKNALIPVVTVISVSFGGLLGGQVVMESLFSIPGLGSLLLDAIRVRDLTAVQTVVLFIAVGFMVVNLITDLLYGLIDPRIRVT